MHKIDYSPRFSALMLGAIALLSAAVALADPPARVARLGLIQGAVSFSPAGEDQWALASTNRPLVTGDRLWADAGARTELQVGNAAFRMNGETSVTLLNLDDHVAQLQLAQGSLAVKVRRLKADDLFEVDTPNLAFSIRRAGEYRIDVDPAGNATAVVVRSGQGEVYGEGAAYVVDPQHSYRFMGTGLREYEQIGTPQVDAFDTWSAERDRRGEGSVSARYVSPDVIGYEDLDTNGTWRVEAGYGNVWVPASVSVGWSPYHDGHWVWIDPWGWTWVDDAPWGFAVSHYGRWAFISSNWCWVPGPVQVQAVYAPALVAFVGGSNFQLAISGGNVGGIAWFPLGPRDVYRPAYAVSRTYFENINRSNAVINTTVINNYYNNANVTNVVYANQRVPNAIVAVPRTAFAESKPVARAAVRVTPQMIANAPVAHVAAVAPTHTSVVGPQQVDRKPPPQALARPVVVRNMPPAPPPAFAAQQSQLAAKPGVPLDTNARAALKPATTAAPPAHIVTAQKTPAPTSAPPPAPPGRVAQPAEQRGAPAAKGEQQPPATVARPPSGTTPGAPPIAAGAKEEPRTQSAKAAPESVPRPPETRGPPESRVQSAMAPQQSVPRPPVATPPETRGPPQTAKAAPESVARPPETRGPPESRTQSAKAAPESVARPPETRGPPESRPQSAMAPQQSVPRPPLATPPETRGPPPESRTQTAKAAPQSVPRPPVATPPESRPQSAMAPQSAPRPPVTTAPETRGPPESRAQTAKAAPQSVPRPPETRGPPESRAQSATAPQSAAPPAARASGAPGPPPAAAAHPPTEAKPAARGKEPPKQEERNG